MYILPKSLNTKTGEHFPLISRQGVFNDNINLDDINLLYKSFIYSFTFTKRFLSNTTFEANIQDWLTANEVFSDWVMFNILLDSFYTNETTTFTIYSESFNWKDFVEVFKNFFSKIEYSFNGIDDWVEANYVYEDWTNFGSSYYYEYLPYSVFERMLDKYLTAYGWFVFIYLARFDCEIIKDVLNTIPIEVLLSTDIDRFITLFNTNLSEKYGVIVVNDEVIATKKKKFVKFIFNLAVKSFTNTQFIETAYSLFNYNSTRDCIESMGVGFTLDEEFKYNAFIKEW